VGAIVLVQTPSFSLAQRAELIDDRSSQKGFQSIFNGKDLTGWDGNPNLWSVKDGTIMGQTTAKTPAKGNTFLIWTNGTPGDFELRCSFKIVPGDEKGFANSGIQYRSKILDQSNWVVGGYQADMEAGPTYTGILYEERMKRGIMAARGEKVIWDKDCKKQVVGSLGTSEELQAMIKKEDWNDYVVIAKGNHLQHFINGRQTVDVTDDCEAQRAMSGVLALQLHAGPPMTVQFKNIRIRTLDAKDSSNAGGDLKNLQGEWKVVRVEANGSALPSEDTSSIVVAVKGTTYTLLDNGKSDPGRFSIDPSTQPKQMDIHPESGPDQSKTLLAIYELDSDTFRVCYASEGNKRPVSFSTTDNSGSLLIDYKRKTE
jgi:uncharacterized protein (TIGR03067 family)